MEKTKFASPKRTEIKKLIQESGIIKQVGYIDKLIHSLPSSVPFQPKDLTENLAAAA